MTRNASGCVLPNLPGLLRLLPSAVALLLSTKAMIVTRDVAGLSLDRATRVVPGLKAQAVRPISATVDVVQGPGP